MRPAAVALHAVLHAVALVVGAAVAVGSLLVHRIDLRGLPLGLVLALVTTFAVAWAFRGSVVRRLATSYAAGWLVVFGLVLAGRAEGDFAVASDLSGYLMILAACALVVIGISSLFPRGSGSVGGPT